MWRARQRFISLHALAAGILLAACTSGIAAYSELSTTAVIGSGIIAVIAGYAIVWYVVIRALEVHRTGHEHDEQTAAYHIIQTIERERNRISSELHDSVGQALYSVWVGLKIMTQLKIDDSVREHFLQVERLTAQAMEEVKNMALELRPAVLDDLGLVPAIRAYLERYEYTYGIRTKLILSGGEQRYSSEGETALYRICQEALTNTAKYAQARDVEVSILHGLASVQMIVKDNGRGFQLNNQSDKRAAGLGLNSIRDRANLLGGKVVIQSAPGEGTVIQVILPLHGQGSNIIRNRSV